MGLLHETRHSRERQFKYFIELVAKLQADEFAGLLKMFNIKFVELGEKPEEDQIRPFDVVYEELLDKFINSNKEARFNVVWLLEAVTTEEGKEESHKTIQYKGVK